MMMMIIIIMTNNRGQTHALSGIHTHGLGVQATKWDRHVCTCNQYRGSQNWIHMDIRRNFESAVGEMFCVLR
jgi:hypothetical protein